VPAQQPLLLYRRTCPRCRFLSRAVIALSGGGIRRVATDSTEAALLYARHGAPGGKLALRHRGRLHVGRRVFAAAWWTILWCWLVRIPLVGRLWRRRARAEVDG